VLISGCAGLEGSAGAAEPLNEDGADVNAGVGETKEQPLHDHHEETIAAFGEPAGEGLSLFVKLVLVTLVLLACYVFVRMYSARQMQPAGRHGAY